MPPRRAGGGAAGLAGAPAARPARVADEGRDRRLVDARRSEAARQRRAETTYAEPRPPPPPRRATTPSSCSSAAAIPDLAPASQAALPCAVGGLTTRQIADACYVPEATMVQRISRAKRALQERRPDQPGGPRRRAERALPRLHGRSRGPGGPGRRRDPARPPARARHRGPEARGLLALMLLNHARLPARLDPEGR
jgi:hypothetical protein